LSTQSCQMVLFQTINPNLGKFWMELKWKILVYFLDIWSIFQPFGICHSHLVNVLEVWYISPVLVCCTKKNLATLENKNFGFQGYQISL
jgi:hypothetical protein